MSISTFNYLSYVIAYLDNILQSDVIQNKIPQLYFLLLSLC